MLCDATEAERLTWKWGSNAAVRVVVVADDVAWRISHSGGGGNRELRPEKQHETRRERSVGIPSEKGK